MRPGTPPELNLGATQLSPASIIVVVAVVVVVKKVVVAAVVIILLVVVIRVEVTIGGVAGVGVAVGVVVAGIRGGGEGGEGGVVGKNCFGTKVQKRSVSRGMHISSFSSLGRLGVAWSRFL